MKDKNVRSWRHTPIVLSDDRVTEEDAPIGVLQPHHPLQFIKSESRKLTLRTGSGARTLLSEGMGFALYGVAYNKR
jgi:hypothetical protein